MDNRPSAEMLAEQAGRLFTLPDIVFKLQEMIYSDTSTVQDIAELISHDPALTARLLRLANSSFYSFPAKIDTVSAAVTLVGTSEIYNLALATVVVGTMQTERLAQLNLKDFWQQSVLSGLVARNLAEQAGFRQTEAVFVAGLLHRIGYLVVAEQWGEVLPQLDQCDASVLPWEHEENVLGFTLAECGYHLLREWQLPETLSQSVRWQHKPERAEDIYRPTCWALHVASYSVADHLLGGNGRIVHEIKPAAWESLQLDDVAVKLAMENGQNNLAQIVNILS